MAGFLQLDCCGWKEMHYVSNYYGNLKSIVQDLVDRNVLYNGMLQCGALLFTEAGTRSKYATHLARDIRNGNLGEVTKLPKFKNPNTKHIIQSYMWIPNQDALVAYCKENNVTKNPYVY